MRYEFRTADGDPCCKADKIEHLCGTCKRRARGVTTATDAGAGDPYAAHDAAALRIATEVATGADDPYADGLTRLRALHGIAAPTDDGARLAQVAANRHQFYQTALAGRLDLSNPATSDVHLNPPDPYAPGLDRMRRENR